MKNPINLELHKEFSHEIDEFINNPKKYEYDIKSRFIRHMYNAKDTFLVWFLICISINILFIAIFMNTSNKVETASLFSILALLFTVMTRNHTINLILFDKIGNSGKHYFFHQLSNSIGFMHRFMAITATVWFSVHLNYALETVPADFLYLGFNLLILLVVIMTTALAFFRRKHHNTFENIHRYFGYIAVFLLTIYYIQINSAFGYSFAQAIVKPHFLLICIIVILLVTPWIGTKKVSPKVVHTGPHVVGIQINGEPSFGTYTKITLANGYYHPFGDSMINFDDFSNRTLYITPSGDRTKKVVNDANHGENALEKCTIKKQRNRGFMYNHSVYDHVLIVVTGGGIAPIIPCLILNKKTKIDVLWIGRAQDKEFTSELLANLTNQIQDQEIGLHILDTTSDKLKGFKTQNYISLALSAYEHYKPEAVFVMSNQKFTIDMVYALKKENIKAYGANFDS